MSIYWALSRLVARSLMVSLSWVSHDQFFLRLCWKSESILCCSKNFMMLLYRMFSLALHQLGVKDTHWSLQFEGPTPISLEDRGKISCFHSLGI